MNQWYCLVGGQQYGPVSEEKLREWIAQGRIKGGDYVWREGMTEWKFLRDIPELNTGLSAAPPPFGGTMPKPSGGTGGTGGTTPNNQISAKALESLQGKWGISIGFCLLFGVFSIVCQMIPQIGGLIWLVLAGPFELGAIIYFLHVTRQRNGDIGMLFKGFSYFGAALGVNILVGIFVFLWTLLAFLPGIVVVMISFAIARATIHGSEPPDALFFLIILAIVPPIIVSVVKQLSYSQALYLVADNPKIGILNAIRTSKERMDGKKSKLFCIHLRILGWSLLCLLTLGIGLLWLAPYARALQAAFYNDLLPSSAPLMTPEGHGPTAQEPNS